MKQPAWPSTEPNLPDGNPKSCGDVSIVRCQQPNLPSVTSCVRILCSSGLSVRASSRLGAGSKLGVASRTVPECPGRSPRGTGTSIIQSLQFLEGGSLRLLTVRGENVDPSVLGATLATLNCHRSLCIRAESKSL